MSGKRILPLSLVTTESPGNPATPIAALPARAPPAAPPAAAARSRAPGASAAAATSQPLATPK